MKSCNNQGELLTDLPMIANSTKGVEVEWMSVVGRRRGIEGGRDEEEIEKRRNKRRANVFLGGGG
jgi:hypothetical protein